MIGENNCRKQKLLVSDRTDENYLFQDLKKIAKTRGHRVAKMTPQISIFMVNEGNKS
jgi:uncharacterized lipoprotein